jgi:hydrogenase maturation protease
VRPERLDWPGISETAIRRLEKVLRKFKKFVSTYGIEVDVDGVLESVKRKSNEPW